MHANIKWYAKRENSSCVYIKLYLEVTVTIQEWYLGAMTVNSTEMLPECLVKIGKF